MLLKALLCFFQGSLPGSAALEEAKEALLPAALPHLWNIHGFADHLHRFHAVTPADSPSVEVFTLI